ncbi:uncharacterized protein MKZ38_009183 [Zalerion maritima]|uniref:Uncharacterized protein n=1 Tax=Zalerion maritima TaxID=339359 RepID=A0AAD5WV88_9PEZI|nr:uncharacterized protein MKZ38_009183 [Zalerion maritima]
MGTLPLLRNFTGLIAHVPPQGQVHLGDGGRALGYYHRCPGGATQIVFGGKSYAVAFTSPTSSTAPAKTPASMSALSIVPSLFTLSSLPGFSCPGAAAAHSRTSPASSNPPFSPHLRLDLIFEPQKVHHMDKQQKSVAEIKRRGMELQ